MVTLAGALGEDLLAGFAHVDGVPRTVLLWLDPESQFTRLRGALSAELASRGATLVTLDAGGSQLATKLMLLDLETDGARAVVHAAGWSPRDLDPQPDGRAPALWAFAEYRYKGAVWRVGQQATGDAPTLDSWLTARGVRFGPGRTRSSVTAGGPDSRLARYAARNAHLDLAQFPQPVTAQSLNLTGDPRDLMVELLLDPRGAVDRWGEDIDVVRDLALETYGLALEGEPTDAWAEELAVHLALTDVWDATGRLPDYPFGERIPPTAAAERALALVRKAILPRADVRSRLHALVRRREQELGGLVSWAASKAGLPAAVPAILDRRLATLLDDIDSAPDVSQALDRLDKGVGALSSPADPRFELLRRLFELGVLARAQRDALVGGLGVRAMADQYAREAWQVDATYLEVMAGCRDRAELAAARRLAARIYAAYLEAVSQRFTDLVEHDRQWPPPGLPTVRDAASEVWERPTKARERRGIVIVDALRMDVARAIESRLGSAAELRAVSSTLPTTTPFGMTALLPGDNAAFGVDVATSVLRLFTEDIDSLEDRKGRKELLAQVLEGRGDSVAFVELEQLLQGDPVPSSRYVVAFSYALDDRGHSAADTASLPDEAPKTAARVAAVIERLHSAGIARVDVLTDHGFLWLSPDDVDALGTPAVPPAQVTKKAPRYAILVPGAAAGELMHLPLPFDPTVTLGFPRGIRTLGKAGWYNHGGVSLHEAVIPHLKSRAAASADRLRVSFTIPVMDVVGATIPVRVRPELPAGEQLPLQAPAPIRVRLSVAAPIADKPVSVAEPVTIEVRRDSPELGTALYLAEGIRIPAGTILRVLAHDDETQELLLERELPLVTDWE